MCCTAIRSCTVYITKLVDTFIQPDMRICNMYVYVYVFIYSSYWTWLEPHLASLTARPTIALGDFNAKYSYKSMRLLIEGGKSCKAWQIQTNENSEYAATEVL